MEKEHALPSPEEKKPEEKDDVQPGAELPGEKESNEDSRDEQSASNQETKPADDTSVGDEKPADEVDTTKVESPEEAAVTPTRAAGSTAAETNKDNPKSEVEPDTETSLPDTRDETITKEEVEEPAGETTKESETPSADLQSTDKGGEESTPTDTEQKNTEPAEVPTPSETETQVTDKAGEVALESKSLASASKEPEEKEIPDEIPEETKPAAESDEDESDREVVAEEPEEAIDFDSLTRDELVDHIVALKDESDMPRVDRQIKELKSRYDGFFQESREKALQAFLKEEGAEEDDFRFKGDEQDERFFDYFDLLRDKCKTYFQQLESQKDENLKKKTEILDKIRELVDGEESNTSIQAVRALQDEWKSIGPVPAGQHRLLWANYNALLDRYYDARSIYFELKDLDRKKNLKAKLELCEKVEALDQEKNLKTAISQLNEFHEEFKNLGPVPREDQESLWQRFKAASDTIYAKRKVFVEELKKELTKNYELKQELADQVAQFQEFSSDRISEWNEKTKEILSIQKKWESIGGVPRDKAKQVNKVFWAAFKKFFSNKNEFFKELDSHRDENLKLKEGLIAQADSLKESQEWDKVAEEFKKLQQQWRDIGPVPDKQKNEIYKKFKAACDHFFEQRRAHNQVQFQEYENNLKEKESICDELVKLAKVKEVDLDKIHDLIDTYHSIGFVPRNAIKRIRARFQEATQTIMTSEHIPEEDREELRTVVEVSRMRATPGGDRKIARQENTLRRKISNLESDIDTWKTNIEFFASSKNADKLRDEVETKLKKAEQELEDLKSQLTILRNS